LSNKTIIYSTLALTAGIYMILNNINGKMYIGSTVNIANRLKQHINGIKSNLHLQSALKKYGLQNFSLIVLDICTPDKMLLLALEQLAFNLYKPPGGSL